MFIFSSYYVNFYVEFNLIKVKVKKTTSPTMSNFCELKKMHCFVMCTILGQP